MPARNLPPFDFVLPVAIPAGERRFSDAEDELPIA